MPTKYEAPIKQEMPGLKTAHISKVNINGIKIEIQDKSLRMDFPKSLTVTEVFDIINNIKAVNE